MKNSVLSIYENWFFSGVDEYIKSGSKEAIVDRDPELIYTKREKLLENKKTAAKKRLNLERQLYYCFPALREVQLPNEWIGNLTSENGLFFSGTEMEKFVALTGESLGCAG